MGLKYLPLLLYTQAMANRAYLFFIEKPEDVGFPDRNAIRYFDSRHNVPFAWLLFFGPDDIVLKPVHSGGSTWNEIYLVAPWHQAKARFLERCKYLPTWFENRIQPGEAEAFAVHVEDFAGEFLVLDGQEIAEDEIAYEQNCRAMLLALEAGTFDTRLYSGGGVGFTWIWDEVDRREVDDQKVRDRVFGITYWSVGELSLPGDDDIRHRVN